MSGMAEVLALHGIYGMSGGVQSACRCDGRWVTHAEYRAHLEAELTAAGFGSVAEAKAGALEEAADDYRHYETPNARLYLRARAAAVRGEG